MSVFNSTCIGPRWFITALLGGLGLAIVSSGYARGADERGVNAIRKDSPTPENVKRPATLAIKKPPPKNAQLATFFGSTAIGHRFCIIADASNSVKGAPLSQIKKEILKTLDNLRPGSQFYIIFFNATDVAMPYPNWLDAGKENVDKVSPWVENMSTVYKTLPQSAFERAFKLDPRPDVIYFLSDGFLQGKDPVAHVKALNAVDPKVTIHTIRFSKEQGKTKAKSKAKARTEGAAEQLRAIAENNGGTFRNVSQE